MPRTRDQVVYQATCEQIKAVARQQMAAEGTAALSLRAIARQMEITAPAIYRYYPTRDHLITALIVDAFDAYAAALDEADRQAAEAGATTAGRLLAVLLAYREWALHHAIEFQLIYGSPIPGYHAPAEQTTPVAVRSLLIILKLLVSLEQTGQICIPDAYQPGHLPPPVADALAGMREQYAPQASIGLLYLSQAGWARLHGMIMLEAFHHNTTTVGDGAAFYHAECLHLMALWGIPAITPPAQAHSPPA